MSNRRGVFPIAVAAFVLGSVFTAVFVPDRPQTVSSNGALGSGAGTGTGTQTETETDPGTYPGTDPGASGPAGAPLGGSPSAAGPGTTPTTGMSSAGGPAAGGPSATTAPQAAATATDNGGATFRGVTATEIKIGIADLDSSDLAPVCPRCDNGPSKKGGAALGLLAAWKRDGLLPIHGRTITPVFRVTNVTSAEQQRKACVEMAQQEKPFLVVVGPGVAAAGVCLAQEFKMQVVSAGQTTDQVISSVYPNWVEVAPTIDRLLRNNAHWAKANGLLTGKKIGIYSWEVDNLNTAADSFRREIGRLGAEAVVDMRASGTQGVGSTSASDGVAVQRFRAAGVEVAFLFTSALGFQSAALAQGYRPAYPIVDTGYNHTDAVADVFVNPDAQDGNLGYTPKQWVWAKRRPATPAGNPAATYCLKAYSDYTKRVLDVFDNDAEIRYVQNVCSALQVTRESLANAGPNLTQGSFLQGLFRLNGFNTADYPSVSFSRDKLTGADVGATAQFKKARWSDTNDYWRVMTPYTRFPVP